VTYLLDDDVFIQAKNLHYGFAFCPAFWDWLDRSNAAGLVFSIDKVVSDLQGHQDGLAQWAATRPRLFQPTDASVLKSYSLVSNWANAHPRYDRAAIAEFLTVTDAYLVAHGHAKGLIVVTHEKSEPLSKARIKIPDACIAMGVESMTPFQMLRAEAPQFVLAR
jgi:uncharacterized protein DUF4411